MKKQYNIAQVAIIAICASLVSIGIYKISHHSLTDLQYANYNTLPYKIEVIQAYDKYYNATEKLLDEICEYEDIASGSDAYCDYIESVIYLGSILEYEKDN